MIIAKLLVVIAQWSIPLLWPVCLSLLAIALWKKYIESLKDKRSDLPLPPGTVGLPFVGETFSMFLKGWRFYQDKRAKYGRVYKTHIIGRPTIRVWGSDNIAKVLKGEEREVTMCWPKSVSEILGQRSVVCSERRDHTKRKAFLLRQFSQKQLIDATPNLDRMLAGYISSWIESPNVLQFLPEAKKMTFEVSVKMLIGQSLDAEHITNLMACMHVIVDNMFVLPVKLPGTGFQKAMKARARMIEIFDEAILNSNVETIGGCKSSEKDNFQGLFNLRKSKDILSTEEIKDSLIEMLFSSYNGLTSVCCSIIIALSENNDVLQKLEKSFSTANSDDDGFASAYIDQVMKEVLRVAPPFGGGFRKVLKTFELEGYQIPAGWTVLYSIRDNHEAEENFENASTFNPDRWSHKQSETSFIPFGGNGIRSCPARYYTCQFIKSFIKLLVQTSTWKIHQVETKQTYFPVHLPIGGLPVSFEAKK